MSKMKNEDVVIKGLTYVPDFITCEKENELTELINSASWISDLKRRVQHYGYKYDYKLRGINKEMSLGSFPDWVEDIAQKLFEEKYMSIVPNQMIVNEYLPGQGISNHIDCMPCFDNTIVSLSLNSHCIMNLINLKTKEKIELLLEPRSLVILQDEARYLWTHGIPPRKKDVFDDIVIHRNTRLSLTFRNTILN